MKKVALITGASSGLGREYARVHASRGGDLVLVARRLDRLNELKAGLEAQYQVDVLTLSYDLSRPEAPQQIYDALADRGIEVDYLINNAGLGGQGSFAERPIEEEINLISVDIVALTRLTKLFLPDFLRRGTGRILNVSSTASLLPGPLPSHLLRRKGLRNLALRGSMDGDPRDRCDRDECPPGWAEHGVWDGRWSGGYGTSPGTHSESLQGRPR